MDSSPTDAGQLPPTLPAKQRRSLYSRSSSTSSVEVNSRKSSMAFPFPSPESSPSMPSAPLSLPSSPSCDCFAPQCPIHHRYEPSDCHQERYYSEKTPPPIPKKRLARTLSLPGEFPTSPYIRPTLLPRGSNPLYMLSPLEDVVFDPGSGAEEGAAETQATGTPPQPCQPSALPLAQLNFDTPDEQLPHFLSDLGDRAQVSESMQQHLLLFLRSAAERMEKSVLRVEEEPMQIQPQDLVMCGGEPTLVTQDGALHHRVRHGGLQGQEFSIQARREPSTPTPSPLQPHLNVQQVICQFPASQEIIPHAEEKGEISAPVWPQGGSSDVEMQQGSTACDKSESTVLSLLSQGYCVTISRDLTQGSLEEFVLKGNSPSGSQPEVYHRRLVLLLLQVTQALQHLKTHGPQVTDLDPRNILLAWRENGGGWEKFKTKESRGGSRQVDDKRRLSNCERKDGAAEMNPEEELDEEHGGRAERLWRRWGTPRVVLSLCASTTQSSQPITSHPIQLGLLLQRCLHLPEGTASHAKAPPHSPYSQGLLRLLSQLLAPGCGIQMADVVPMLQALLWGPRASLFQHSPSDPTTIHNWLLVKRSLLLLKLAERGLFSDQLAVDWEDYLCLQYFCLTDPHAVLNATAKLGLHKTEL